MLVVRILGTGERNVSQIEAATSPSLFRFFTLYLVAMDGPAIFAGPSSMWRLWLG
jgi:hypothetical protein